MLKSIPQEELNKLCNVNAHISVASTLTTVLHDLRRIPEMLRTVQVQIMWTKCQMTPAWLYIFCLFIQRDNGIGETQGFPEVYPVSPYLASDAEMPRSEV